MSAGCASGSGLKADGGGYQAILIVGFGGPEGPGDVMPFLENVTRGRGVPRERLLEVAEHYHHFGGKSPLNDQVRDLIRALRAELDRHGVELPIYWGNRNWHPLLADTMRAMVAAGIERSIGLVLAAYSSYSSCRQYRENIAAAQAACGPGAPEVDKIRVFYNHPDFIAANCDRLREALDRLPAEYRSGARVAFTAHSIPLAMASACAYEHQLRETCRLVAQDLGMDHERWSLVYQSRSGRPQDPWLEPDILDHIRKLHQQAAKALVIHPIGFLSDHMEVLYDLDEEARQLCDALGVRMERAATVGVHPLFVSMLRELIVERLEGWEAGRKRAAGVMGPSHDVCPADCCPAPVRGPAQTPPTTS